MFDYKLFMLFLAHVNADRPEMDNETPAVVRGIKMADMLPGEQVRKTVYLQAVSTQERRVSVKVSLILKIKVIG